MRLLRIDHAIETCREHLAATGSFDTEIEAYLTRYLLVMAYTAVELHIQQCALLRAQKSGDLSMEEFVRAGTRKLCRSVKTSEIAAFLGCFGNECKDRFQRALNTHQQAETAFNNIITHRHAAAHSEGAQLTFREFERFYDEGHVVLDDVRDALELQAL